MKSIPVTDILLVTLNRALYSLQSEINRLENEMETQELKGHTLLICQNGLEELRQSKAVLDNILVRYSKPDKEI